MATPTYATVLSQINAFIVANGNNEITANVLNPILKLILDFASNNIGDLSTLTTDENNSIVEAINSLKNNFNDLVNNGVQLYQGYDNPNDVPPPSYKYADFYMQLDIGDDSPIYLWQWNGFEWVTNMIVPNPEFSALLTTDFERLVSNQQDFTLPDGAVARFATVNGSIWNLEQTNNLDEIQTFTQTDLTVSFKTELVTNNKVEIFYQLINN